MQTSVPNPFHGLSRLALARALADLRREMATVRERSAEDRAALAQRVVHALIVMEQYVAPSERMPATPDKAIADGAHPCDAYRDWAAHEQRLVRLQAIMCAAEAMRGAGAYQWLVSAAADGRPRRLVAMEGEGGFVAMLDELRSS